jgi:hypothetical protein
MTPGIEWHEAGTECAPLYGKRVLNFNYQGEGNLDFKSSALS